MTTRNLFGGEEASHDETTRHRKREAHMKGQFTVTGRMPAAHREKHGLKPGDTLPDDWDEAQRKRWLRMSYIAFDATADTREKAVKAPAEKRAAKKKPAAKKKSAKKKPAKKKTAAKKK